MRWSPRPPASSSTGLRAALASDGTGDREPAHLRPGPHPRRGAPRHRLRVEGPSREEVRAFLDATYQADPNRANTWLSPEAVKPTADKIAARISPRDRITEQESEFMRQGDYIVAVFPEAQGSRAEFDDYQTVRNRYLPIIGGFWGGSPSPTGPEVTEARVVAPAAGASAVGAPVPASSPAFHPDQQATGPTRHQRPPETARPAGQQTEEKP